MNNSRCGVFCFETCHYRHCRTAQVGMRLNKNKTISCYMFIHSIVNKHRASVNCCNGGQVKHILRFRSLDIIVCISFRFTVIVTHIVVNVISFSMFWTCRRCAGDVPWMCRGCAGDVQWMCRGCAGDVQGMCRGCAGECKKLKN